ncbi:MAG TPA: hypothetical protein VEH27_06245 [Methylomirabilota bacterium]|nr:hypothetical protein [Methylomirabilota bacterium]
MTWIDLMKALGSEFQKLRPGKISARESFLGRVNSLARAERQNSPRLDDILRNYIKTQKWPELQPNDLFFLRERYRFAYEYAGIASITLNHPRQMLRNPGPKSTEDAAILEFLLVDVWNRTGVRNWLAPLHRMQEVQRQPGKSHPGSALA